MQVQTKTDSQRHEFPCRQLAIGITALIFLGLGILSPAILMDLSDQVRKGNLGRVKFILLLQPNRVAEFDESGWTALHVAARYNRKDIAEQLINSGADVSVRDQLRVTPLHVAAKFGHIEMVNLLIKKNAEVNALDSRGVSPIQGAVWFGHSRVEEILLNAGATPPLSSEGTPVRSKKSSAARDSGSEAKNERESTE